MEAAALTVTVRSHFLAGAARPAHGGHCRRSMARVHGRRRLRALPPELSEILAPKLVPGSPADTGDVSSLIPVGALLLLFYLVSNWVFPAVIMKGMEPTAEEAAAADGEAKTRVKVKKKRRRKAAPATEV